MNLYRPFTLSPEEREEIAREEAWEAAREEIYIYEFLSWIGADESNREGFDFSDWLVSRAQKHMVDNERYRTVMTAEELRRVDHG